MPKNTNTPLADNAADDIGVAPRPASPIYLAACVAICNSANAAHADMPTAHTEPLQAFNTSFLHGQGRPADLSAVLSSSSSVPPGTYRVEVHVNGDLVDRREIDFYQDRETGKLSPCLTPRMLQEFGVDPDAVVPRLDTASHACVDLSHVLEHAAAEFDSGRLQLNLSIPQAYLSRSARGYVDPALWDRGVNAGYVNYQLSGDYGHGRVGRDSSTYFVGLQNGVNIGRWRLRNESTLVGGNGMPTRFSSNRTLVQRDVDSIKGQLTLGEQYSDATLFDSIRFRGVQVTSDDAMLPDSERGYAPVVRGQAATNAVIEVRQSGYVLYRANVPPGPFQLTDIFPSGSNGDLEITVIEADGSRHVTHQAFSSLPLMLRRGRFKYSFAAGKYQGAQGPSPLLTSGSIVYGLTDNSTVAGGFQLARDFQALNVGVGTNTPIGALSVDVTQSSSRVRGKRSSGQSVRVLYAKTFTRTNTNFTLAAYRYSTSGYRTFSDHVNELGNGDDTGMLAVVGGGADRSRSRIDLTTSQDLGGAAREYGSVYLNVTHQTFWGRPGVSRSVSVGYGGNWKQLSYNLNLSQTRDTRFSGANNSQVMLTMSMPLGSKLRSPRAYTNVSHDGGGRINVQSGLNGFISDEMSYAIQTGYATTTRNATGGASITGDMDVGQLNASVNVAKDYQSGSIGATGALVLHRGGINLSRSVGDTFALLKADGLKGTNLKTDGGTPFGRNGYAVATYAQPYRLNNLSLDTRDLGADVELDDTVKQVVPRRGAIVRATFTGYHGQRAQFALQQGDGTPVPFGASVEDAQTGRHLGIADPNGNAFVLLSQDQGTLTVKWKSGRCQAPYALREIDAGRHYVRQTVRCQ
ncbi:fimbria/pilus outer membrane usher protein [Burkholderia contaminans]|uniref:fimbria/pilus outer membrane usher protein n=1 Tax=Burkholderia contaminans TaxID=488447 RepID=UPI0024174AD2|nr:fimbria/pilus outer membrane usher protein [Burkholderia contaminans]WFN13060.1 fimbrial biogenesis outer membrane usher protein [Burkholderia contaminans]